MYAWDKVSDLFSVDSETCRKCEHFYAPKHKRPDDDAACNLGNSFEHGPTDCPALIAWMDENGVKDDDLL